MTSISLQIIVSSNLKIMSKKHMSQKIVYLLEFYFVESAASDLVIEFPAFCANIGRSSSRAMAW